MFILKSGDTGLPSPVSMTINDEIIWSADTGRTLDGTMIGDVIAEKKNISIKWEWLTEAEVATIKSRLIAGFYPLTFHDDGVDQTIESYRGTLSKEVGGDIGSVFYYRSVSVDIIQR